MDINSRQILLISSICFLLACGRSDQIIGKWKIERNANMRDSNSISNSGWEYLQFDADSTFIMYEDSLPGQVMDTTPGWHVGHQMKGTWRLKNNQLLLFTGNIPLSFPLRFNIVQLTSDRLKLAPSIDLGDSTMVSTYSRVN